MANFVMKIKSVESESVVSQYNPRGGRPRKFNEPSKAVTLTLPERILGILDRIGPDRACAISRLSEATLDGSHDRPFVELVHIDSRSALIVVSLLQSLKKITWLRLVEIAPGRFLLAIPSGTPPEKLEVALRDLMDDLCDDKHGEKSAIGKLTRQISHLRRHGGMSKSEIIFVDLDSSILDTRD